MKGRSVVLWTVQLVVPIKGLVGKYIARLYPYIGESQMDKGTLFAWMVKPWQKFDLKNFVVTMDSHYYGAEGVKSLLDLGVGFIVAVSAETRKNAGIVGRMMALLKNPGECVTTVNQLHPSLTLTLYWHRAETAGKEVSLLASNIFLPMTKKRLERGVQPLPTLLYRYTFGECDAANFDQSVGNLGNKYNRRSGEAGAWDDIWHRQILCNVRTIDEYCRGQERGFKDVVTELAKSLHLFGESSQSVVAEATLNSTCDCETCVSDDEALKAAADIASGIRDEQVRQARDRNKRLKTKFGTFEAELEHLTKDLARKLDVANSQLDGQREKRRAERKRRKEEAKASKPPSKVASPAKKRPKKKRASAVVDPVPTPVVTTTTVSTTGRVIKPPDITDL